MTGGDVVGAAEGVKTGNCLAFPAGVSEAGSLPNHIGRHMIPVIAGDKSAS